MKAHESTDVPKAEDGPINVPVMRWPWRRLISTAIYSVAGAGLGVLGPPLFSVCAISVSGVPGFLMTLPGAAVFGLLCRAGTKNSTKIHPCAPKGISLGIALGALVMTIFFLFFLKDLGTSMGTLLGGAAGAWGAYVGGMEALRSNLGPVRFGIGRTCFDCGYDLTASESHTRCPECGGMERFDAAPSA